MPVIWFNVCQILRNGKDSLKKKKNANMLKIQL